MNPKYREVSVQIQVADDYGQKTGIATVLWRKETPLEGVLRCCIHAVENIDL